LDLTLPAFLEKNSPLQPADQVTIVADAVVTNLLALIDDNPKKVHPIQLAVSLADTLRNIYIDRNRLVFGSIGVAAEEYLHWRVDNRPEGALMVEPEMVFD